MDSLIFLLAVYFTRRNTNRGRDSNSRVLCIRCGASNEDEVDIRFSGPREGSCRGDRLR